jgi:hypothetical protein
MSTARALIATLLLVAGCGYHLPGASEKIPATAHTVSIKLFSNHTKERGLEVRLRRALEDEFHRRSPLRVVPDPGGDLVLSGVIRRFSSTPVAFSSTDEAVQYQGVLQVSLTLTERETGHVIYSNPLLQETQDFGAVSGVVLTTSPHFQRGTVDRRDLENLTNVQLGETRKAEALDDLLDRLASDVYLQALEGF